MTVEQKLQIAEAALLFYSRMQYHPREVKIRTVIDRDNGQKATEALEKINPELAKPFFDNDIKQ